MRKRAKGQTMAIIGLVLALGVLIGLVAIAVDGGSALLQRRNMQNSSDSGALAGVQLMSQKVIISGGNPGHPTYALTDTLLLSTVNDLAVQNRGGTVGAVSSDYAVSVYFHYMVGSPPPYANGGFDPNPVSATGAFIPDFVDGLRVKANVHNPTTFAKAIPGPWSNIDVGATTAYAIFPTCRVAPPAGGATLPFTRFRYSFEQELPVKGNNLCDPFVFWDSDGDVGGPGNGDFKNKLSFNTRSFYQDADPPSTPPDTEQQLLSGFDHRNGIAPPVPQPPSNPFDMRGSAKASGNLLQNDVAQWLRYGWQGTILTGTNRINNPSVLGDWGEVVSADQGQNVQSPLLDLIRTAPDRGQTAISAPWPQGLGWGTAITRTVYLWGDGTLPSGTSAQQSNVTLACIVRPCNCNQNPDQCTRTVTWDNLNIRRQNANQITADGTIQRVRFTDAVQIQFYENVNGGGGHPRCPDGSNLPNDTNTSEARGVLPSAVLPGPPGGGTDSCPSGWAPGDGIYYRQIGP